MSELSHSIYRLAVDNENEQNVFFREGSENEINTKIVDTTLTAWFKLNKKYVAANKYLYCDIPNYYVFDEKCKMWNVRKKFKKQVLSRMYLVSPRRRERFYLRLLLLHVSGATSFEDLINSRKCN